MHTKDLRVTSRNGLSTGEGDTYRSIGIAYGWNEEPIYDAGGKLVNDLTPTDEALANAQLWAAAPELLESVKLANSMVDQIHKAFGAPGDYGYETKEGKALFALYKTSGVFAAAIRKATQPAEAIDKTESA